MKITPQAVVNAAQAAGRVTVAAAQGKDLVVDEPTKMARRSHCSTCPENENGQCMKCLCNIRLKTLTATEKCPLDPPKWLAVTA